ncbi:MAG TPA: Hsp20/alpha crystallin family protein [Bryobacteraceae bacterium]|jgi:HSP20 family protein
MSEIAVASQPNSEKRETGPWPVFNTPLSRGSRFSLNPFALIRQFADQVDRAWGDTSGPTVNTAAWTPAIEAKETGGKFVVTAELPGLKKDQVKVRIEGDALVIEGERTEEKEEECEGYYLSERSYGKFYRSVPLPEGAKADQTAALFRNGVLEVSVPVTEVKAKRQEIPVQKGAKDAA